MVLDIVVLFEGLSFITLLLFHFINFRQQVPGADEHVQIASFKKDYVNDSINLGETAESELLKLQVTKSMERVTI